MKRRLVNLPGFDLGEASVGDAGGLFDLAQGIVVVFAETA
jgi:hypothetical protein